MPWWLWGILANVMIVGIEYLNRSAGTTSFFGMIKITALPILIAQMGLFYCWRNAPTMLLAWGVFTAGNCILRLISVTWFVGEVPNPTMLAGVALVMGGVLLVKAGG